MKNRDIHRNGARDTRKEAAKNMIILKGTMPAPTARADARLRSLGQWFGPAARANPNNKGSTT